MKALDIELLRRVADAITTGFELCGSRWNKAEAEFIACQAISSCRLNYQNHGDAFSWQGTGTLKSGGNGLVNNNAGLQLLIEDGCIVLEPYNGELVAPADAVRDAAGLPMVIRITQRLLETAASMCGVYGGV